LFSGIINAIVLKSFQFSVPTIAIAVILFGLFGYQYFSLPKSSYKKATTFHGKENRFIFKDDKFTVSSESSQLSGFSEVCYTLLAKVCETSSYFFLYPGQNQAYLIRKSDIINGTPEQLRQILLKHLLTQKYFISKWLFADCHLIIIYNWRKCHNQLENNGVY